MCAVVFVIVLSIAGIAPVVAASSTASSSYQMSEAEVPSVVKTGNTFSVSARLERLDTPTMNVVEFRLDTNGDGQFTHDESLATDVVVVVDGPSEQVDFKITLPQHLKSDEYEYMIWSEGSNITGTVEVRPPVQPATVLLSGASAPASVTSGESFTVDANVTNVGDLSGSQSLRLHLNVDGNDSVAEESLLAESVIELASDERKIMSMSTDAPETPGEYTLMLSAGGEQIQQNITVTEPVESASPVFQVTEIDAKSVKRSGRTNIDAIVQNTGDERTSSPVELRLDQNRDGTLEPNETVRTYAVQLSPGNRHKFDFNVDLPPTYDYGEYAYGVFVQDEGQTGTFTVYQVNSETNEEESPAEATRTDVAQALYGLDYDTLSNDSKAQVQEAYNQLPAGISSSNIQTNGTTWTDVSQALYGLNYDALSTDSKLKVQKIASRLPAEIPLSEIRTRKQIAQGLYGEEFLVESNGADAQAGYALNKTEATTVQDTYDAQFGPLPGADAEYTLDEVSKGLFGTEYENLSPSASYQVHAVYNRQPYTEELRFASRSVDNSNATDVIRTQRQIGQVSYRGVMVRNTQTLASNPGFEMNRLFEVYAAWTDQFEER